MMSIASRERIINSYSKVLADILFSLEDGKSFFQELYNFAHEINSEDFYVNPLTYGKYKKAISDIVRSFKVTNEVQKILLLIFKRHYGYLFSEIIEQTKLLLNNKLHITEVFVFSKNKLPDHVKQKIEKEINNQVGNAEIEYKIDASVKDGCVNFMSNGNICCLDLKKISEKFLIN